MKFNWGTGIVVAIVAFMSFILFMVITMTTDKKYSHDFVTDKYYQKELAYQQNINARTKAKSLTEKLTIEKDPVSKELKIIFPSNFTPKEIKGKVFLYRPSDKRLDFEISISLTDRYLLVPENSLLDGRWNIDVSFTYKGEKYLHQQEIIY